MKKIDIKQLSQLIKTRIIEDIDLTLIDLNGVDFSFCSLNNVHLSNDSSKFRLISNVSFKNAKLVDVQFENSVLLNVDFSNAILENCSFQVNKKVLKPTVSKVTFAECVINKCRFRNSIINWSDFRYAEITNTTFENSNINFCDFYRTHFHKLNVFRKSQISNSSLNYTLFEGTIIRRENLVSDTILQENRDNYRVFLEEWRKNGPGIRKTNIKTLWKPENLNKELKVMHEHAENIYRNLNGNWVSNGFLSDANWAYVKAKRKERKRLINDMCESGNAKDCFKTGVKVAGNYFSDVAFGYGESISKIIRTYVALIVIFALLIHLIEFNNSIIESFKRSLFNMVAQTDDNIKKESLDIVILTIVQSSIGILLTGIFGFIIANRIRHQ